MLSSARAWAKHYSLSTSKKPRGMCDQIQGKWRKRLSLSGFILQDRMKLQNSTEMKSGCLTLEPFANKKQTVTWEMRTVAGGLVSPALTSLLKPVKRQLVRPERSPSTCGKPGRFSSLPYFQELGRNCCTYQKTPRPNFIDKTVN